MADREAAAAPGMGAQIETDAADIPDAALTTAAVPGQGTPFASWWMLAVLLLFYILSWLNRNILSMLIDPIRASLGINDFQMGLLVGPAFAIFYALFGIPLGWAADHRSRRQVIFMGVILWSACSGMTGLATGFLLMMMTRIGVAGGEAALSPAAYSLMADAFPPHRLTTANAIYQSGIKLGTALSFTLGAVAIAYAQAHPLTLPIIGALETWQTALLVTALPGVLLAPLAFSFREPARPLHLSRSAIPFHDFWRSIRGQRALLLLVICGFGFTNVASGALSWTPAYMERRFAMGAMQYGPALSLIQLVAALSLLLKGGLIDWLYGRGHRDIHVRFYAWLVASAIPVTVVAFMLGNGTIFLVLLGYLQVIAIPFLLYLTPVLQMLVQPNFRGQITGVALFIITLLGSGLGPTAVGFLTSYIFADDAMLGPAIAAVTLVSFTGSLIMLILALRPVRRALEDA
ncbi:MFS transporter [Sphingobium sp. Sx8-8]|uniref:MFS transporter n=1 Tax=Sphingobium sp. Sx8-8 TaxID=2933617 RepID=UPI001F57D3CF|nr:MFS transporter [Sphingobium sp. Sx8-8]